MNYVLGNKIFFMPKTKVQKQEAVQQLVEKLQNAKSAVLTAQRGLTVKASSELRNKCREENVEYLSVKKTLLKIALQEAKIGDADVSSYDGIVGIVLGYDDEVAPARIAHNFSKNNEQLQLHSGVLEGALVDGSKVSQLASLPSKEELLAKLVGSMNAPVSGMVTVLSGTMRGFVQVLDQVREQKESA